MKKLIVSTTDSTTRESDELSPSFPLIASAYCRFGYMRLSRAKGGKRHESN